MAGIFIPGNTISLGSQGSGGGAYSPIGASFDAVYTQDLYSDFGVASTAAAIHSVTRASTKYVEDTSGLWTSVSANTLARSNKGVLIEESRANVVLWNRDLTNAAWTKTNVTAAKDQAGVDGVTNSASSITATAGNGTCLQAITLGSSARWQTAFVKRLTGSGTVQMTMDNGTTWTAVTVTAGWTRVAIPTQTLANPTVGFRLVTSGDAIAVDFVQNENSGVHATSPIETTTGAATRAADVITIDPKYASLAQGSAYVEWEDIGPISSNHRPFRIGIDASNEILLQVQGSNVVSMQILNAGAPQCLLVSSGAVVAGTQYKSALRWGNNDMALALTSSLNASILTDVTGTMPSGTFTINVGSGGGSQYLNGYLRRITFYPRKLTDAELGALVA